MSVTFTGSNHNETETVCFNSGKTVTFPKRVHLCELQEEEFENPLFLNLANGNAFAFLSLLGFTSTDESDLYGEASVPEVRRAVMVARATFDRKAQNFTREEEVRYGKPRDNGDGTVTLKPLRIYGAGLDQDRLANYLDRLAALTEALAEKGATHISWG